MKNTIKRLNKQKEKQKQHTKKPRKNEIKTAKKEIPVFQY